MRSALAAVLILASATGIVLLQTPRSAIADDCPDPRDPKCSVSGTVDGDGVVIRAGEAHEGDTGREPRLATNVVQRCTYSSVREDFERERVLHHNTAVPLRAVFFVRDCGGGEELDWYVPGLDAPMDEAALEGLVAEALKRVEPPVPQVVTSPPLGSEVVTGLPMYLAVDDGAFEVFTGEVSAGQFTVTAEVRPVASRFAPGDDSETLTCDGPGSVWTHGDRPGPEDCTHTFVDVPAVVHGGDSYRVTSQVVYEASYTVDGPILAGSYELGEFDGPEAAVDVPVIERRAVRTVGDS